MRISIEFTRVLSQARKLEDQANALRGEAKHISEIISEIAGAWTGEAAEKYLEKCSRYQEKISRTANELEQTASTLRTTARRLQEAEERAAEQSKW